MQYAFASLRHQDTAGVQLETLSRWDEGLFAGRLVVERCSAAV
jgi:hypothetical protein